MRHFLVSGALAAFAFVTPAAAQGNAAKIQQMCPDLTYNQIGSRLAGLVEQYEFDADPEVAAEQAASLLCPRTAQQAAAPGTQEAVVVLPPPPHHGQRHQPPRFRLPPPPRRHYSAPPRNRVIVVAPPPRPRHHPGYAPRSYAPAVAGHGGYQQGYGMPKQSFHRERGAPYCPTQEQIGPAPTHSRDGRPYDTCEWGAIPNKPCPGWVCNGH